MTPLDTCDHLLIVSHLTPGVDHAIGGPREHAPAFQFVEQLDDLMVMRGDQLRDLADARRTSADRQIAARLAVVAETQEVHPKTARGERTRTQRRVGSPILPDEFRPTIVGPVGHLVETSDYTER